MSNKSRRISQLIEPFRGRGVDAHYLAYFDCFNRQLYFEAHDVLEELWLAQGNGPDYLFHKGLIQLAGGFVHLQKGRLRQAASVFKLAEANLERYAPDHERLDVECVLKAIGKSLRMLEETGFETNPLACGDAPKFNLHNGFS
jgi:predicted metal-dependent hydrolase